MSLTIFTSDRALGKRISRGADGAITKTALGEMTTGTAERVRMQSLRQFAKWRRKLGPKQALAYGVTAHDKVAITTDAELRGLAVSPQRAGMPLVARTKVHFRWPSGAGLMMLDYDPPEGSDPMEPSDLVEALRHAVPELGDVALLWEPSASSCIYDAATGEEVRGVGGQRLYLIVKQADRIPEIGRVLFDRLVLAGCGRIEFSGAGSKLRRTLVDAAVWSPERFDFVSADTGGGLVRRPAESKIFPAANGDDNAWLDPDRVNPLTSAEQERLREIWRDLEAAAEPRAKEVREAAALRRAREELPNGTEEQISARAQQLAAAVANDLLPDDLVLHFHDGRRATVAEARTNAKDYHGAKLADPLDPDGDPRCAQFYAYNKDGTGDPAINSFRHGGKVYVLYAPPDAGGLPGPEEQEEAEGRRAAEPIRNRLMYEDVPAEEAAATLQLLPPKGQEAGLAEIETVDPEVAQQTRELLARIGRGSAAAVVAEPRRGTHLSSVGLSVPLPSELAYNDKGRALASAPNVALACQSPEMIGCVIGFDTFRDELMLTHDGGKNWASFRDEHYAQIEVRLVNEHRFMPIAMELLRRQVYAAGKHNEFDSAKQWLESLPPWDGVPRIERFCSDYLGAEDSEYAHAVGAYTWTALAGRVMVPGIKADMVPVLVGAQGARKSSSIAAISPSPDFFNEIAFDTKDADLSRKLKGLLIGEIAELRGLGTKEVETIKNFITQRYETWTPKFKEMPVRFARRCVFIGSTNDDQFLADKTGERRWLPITIGECRPDLVERDRDQLWAEGLARFRLNGVEWRRAEQLAGAEHDRYKAPDLWEDQISAWLVTEDLGGGRNGDRPFTLSEVCLQALRLETKNVRKADENRIGKILRSLGYESVRQRVDGALVRRWVRR